jgi:hypothetical protein
MNKSLKNILLSEDTGEELKKNGYIKISDVKKDEYEKNGCKVVKSDSGTLYAKCSGTPKKNEPKKDEPKKDEPKKELVTPEDSKSIFDIYSKKIFFYSKNNVPYNIQQFNQQIGHEIDIFISDGFNQPSAFLGAILMNYGTQLTQYQTRKNVQDEIDKNLNALQNTLKSRLNLSEGFKLKKLLGLAQILEQISELVKVNIVNGIPKKTTEDDNYIDTNSKTIESVIEGGDEIRPGERNSTVKIVKPRVGYTVSTDAGNNFTENFKNHLLKYKSEKLLDYNNPNISQQLLCSFDDLQQMYPDWCKKFKKPTPTPSQTTQTNQTPEDIADINSPIPTK